ncbi:MAG: CAP domain-containing protein [Isosphaera sp.]|nr:CAP domain-containing protein [Isosphaera sp.]
MARRPFAALLALVLAPLAAAQDKKDKDGKPTKEEQAVIDLTNAERKKADLPPLAAAPKLTAAARGHAANMAKQDKLNHTLDDKTFADRAKDAGYKYRALGENIAWGQAGPKEVVEGWMNSKPHKENILKDEYTEIGVGVAKNAKGERYWVQVFGKPAGR